MRVCVLARGVPDEGSPLNGIYEWAQAKLLVGCGYCVSVLAIDLRHVYRKRKFGFAYEKKDGVDVYVYSLPIGKRSKKTSSYLRGIFAKKILKIMQKDGNFPDLIWAYFGRTLGNVAYKLKMAYGVPYVVTEYESRLLFSDDFDKKSIFLQQKKVYENASLCVAPSIRFAEFLNKKFGTEFVWLPTAVAVDFSEKTERDTKNYGFLSVGALTVEKGNDVLIRAFSRVKKVCPDVRLTIVGKGDEYRALNEQIKSLALTDSVKFVTECDGSTIHKYMRENDCFVSASRNEIYGVVLLEAMANGLFCITTEPCAPQYTLPPYAGVIVGIDDRYGLEKAMLDAYRAKHTNSAADIKKYVYDNFSQQTICEKIAGYVDSLCL